MVSMSELKRRSSEMAPADPNVQLPAAIRAAAAQSEVMHKQAYQTDEKGTDGKNGNEKETQPEAKTDPTEETTAETPKTPATADDWENRYKAMKGRVDKQDQTVRDLLNELEVVRGENARLRAAPPVVQAPVVRTSENTFKKITDEERETFGDDFIDVAARVARQTLDPEVDELRREVADLKGKLGHVDEITAEQRLQNMNDRLDRDVPNWRALNRDPKFIAWLNLRDPYSGDTRITMMRSAHAAGDASRVATFFKGFLSDEATMAPAAPALNPNEGKVPLETLAAPGRAKTSASQTTATPDAKETISRAQIVAFYKAVNSGAYRGREAEKLQLEKMIFDAGNEGRIVG